MEFNEKDIKKISIFVLIGLLAVLSFIAIRPVVFSIIAGLILAYVFYPVYKRINDKVKNNVFSSIIVLIILIILIIVPLWFIIPLTVQQVFELFRASQGLDVQGFITKSFPTASEQFITQMTVTINTIISKLSSSVLNSLVNLFLNLPTILLNLFVGGFVFFYSLKDSEKLRSFVSGISPINKSKEKIIINQFKAITDSIVYGTFIVGIIQGILTGIGLLIFGIDNALVLTILATFLSIIPILGPYLIWIPVTIILFTSGNTGIAVAYLLYNLIIVSSLDNVLRTYIVSRKTDLSQAIVFIGMIGGIFVFGLLGILLGPLLLGYLVTLLKSYKENNLYSLFSEEHQKEK